jgi:radial spoke head protein 9
LEGLKHDYFIAMAVKYEGQFEFPYKRFYYCVSNDFIFRELPDLNDQYEDFIDQDNSFFTGEPLRKLIQPAEGEEGEEENQDVDEDEDDEKKELDSDVSEPEEIKVPKKDLVEVDRVKYVVLAIENDCQIVPKGAFKMTSQHQVKRNEAFQGVSGSPTNIANYLHFRNVQCPLKKKNLEQPSAPFDTNFLESIDSDLPKGCWNFQEDMQRETVLGRSLLWPGYHFYHLMGQNKFGGVYIGDGLKNLELQFTI